MSISGWFLRQFQTYYTSVGDPRKEIDWEPPQVSPAGRDVALRVKHIPGILLVIYDVTVEKINPLQGSRVIFNKMATRTIFEPDLQHLLTFSLYTDNGTW